MIRGSPQSLSNAGLLFVPPAKNCSRRRRKNQDGRRAGTDTGTGTAIYLHVHFAPAPGEFGSPRPIRSPRNCRGRTPQYAGLSIGYTFAHSFSRSYKSTPYLLRHFRTSPQSLGSYFLLHTIPEKRRNTQHTPPSHSLQQLIAFQAGFPFTTLYYTM